jgi:hypothetical protein
VSVWARVEDARVPLIVAPDQDDMKAIAKFLIVGLIT